jgi:hypothetical protein
MLAARATPHQLLATDEQTWICWCPSEEGFAEDPLVTPAKNNFKFNQVELVHTSSKHPAQT